MMRRATSFLRLQLLTAFLLSLLWATIGSAALLAKRGDFGQSLDAARGVANPVPSTMARIIPEGIPAKTLGRPGALDVFVTATDDIAGMNAAQIA